MEARNVTVFGRTPKWLLGGFLVVGVIGATALVMARMREPLASTPDELFLASAAAREANTNSIVALRTSIANIGFESGTAGYYLVRPIDDPAWKEKFGPLDRSGGFEWWYVHPYYSNITYQNYYAHKQYHVLNAPPQLGDVVISLTRVMSNKTGTASVVAGQGGLFNVSVRFQNNGMGALRQLTANKHVNQGVDFTDWFDITHPSGDAPTAMVIVAVSNNKAYTPIAVDVITSHPPGYVDVTVATGLTSNDATILATRLNGK